MPRGGLRKPKKVEMEEVDCKGYLSVERPHKFKRPKGSHARQCKRCWEGSIALRYMRVFHCQQDNSNHTTFRP